MSRSSPRVLDYYARTDMFDSLGLDTPMPEQQPPSRPQILRCVHRQAVGFDSLIPRDGHYTDNMVKSLDLEAHLADAPALSYLKIRGGDCRSATIVVVDNNLIILISTVYQLPGFLVYIVYDAVKQSISMIPHLPMERRPALARSFLIAPCPEDDVSYALERCTALARNFLIARCPGDDGTYALVKIGEMGISSGHMYSFVRSQDVLFLWRPSSLQWEVITTRFPPQFKGKSCPDGFLAVVAFLCGGRTFWADLLRGVMYCSCDALISAGSIGGDPKLEFSFIDLPLEHLRQLPDVILGHMERHSNVYRTMGHVGESSIKFVTIDGFIQRLGFDDCTVTVWSLSPDEDMTTWTKEHSLRLGSLAEQDKFKKAGLPTDLVPMYPHLSTEEDNVIYFMLGKYAPCCSAHKYSKRKCVGNFSLAGEALYFLHVDMSQGVLLGSARLPDQAGFDFAVCDLNRHLRSPSSANDPETINDDNGRKEKRRREDDN